MTDRRSRRRFVAAIGAALAISGPCSMDVHAQAWPSKPVTIVVPFAPGGMTDIVGRVLAAQLSASLEQRFVIENRPGAAGQIGTEYVARKPADGYTLLLSATGHVIGPAVQKSVRYRPVADFEPIAFIAKTPNMLVVNPAVPANTLPEFIQWAKAQGAVPYGSAGVGGSTHLGGELLRHVSGAPLVHVPYKGASPSTNDVVAGQIPAAVQDSMSVSAFIAAGKLKAIAVTSAERSRLYAQLPTVAESGFKDFDVYTWLGLYAPAGTPSVIVSRLNAEVNRIMSSPDMVARLRKQNAEAGGNLDPAQFRKYVETEVAKWQNTIKLTGVQVD